MGTRADFYIGRGEDAEWLGSIAYDGFPDSIDDSLMVAGTDVEFRERLLAFFSDRDDVTQPEDGWPWPWDNSTLTDYAYAFDDGSVWYSIGDSLWWRHLDGQPPDEDDDDYEEKMRNLRHCTFPDMSARKNVRFDKGSGLIIATKT